jgi:solute:Na+ symporter, SSS family
VMDFYKPHMRPGHSEKHYLFASRIATLIWGVMMVIIAMAAAQWQKSVFEMGLSIASVGFGCLLGVFLLGVLTTRANENGSMVGMITGFVVMAYVWQWTAVAWTWYVMIGTTVTFSVGYLVSLFWTATPEERVLTTDATN